MLRGDLERVLKRITNLGEVRKYLKNEDKAEAAELRGYIPLLLKLGDYKEALKQAMIKKKS